MDNKTLWKLVQIYIVFAIALVAVIELFPLSIQNAVQVSNSDSKLSTYSDNSRKRIKEKSDDPIIITTPYSNPSIPYEPDYVHDKNTNEMYVIAQEGLNVRSNPDTKSRILGSLEPGSKVTIDEFNDKFAKINFNGQDGYIWSKYISKDKDNPESNNSSYSTKSVNQSRSYNKSKSKDTSANQQPVESNNETLVEQSIQIESTIDDNHSSQLDDDVDIETKSKQAAIAATGGIVPSESVDQPITSDASNTTVESEIQETVVSDKPQELAHPTQQSTNSESIDKSKYEQAKAKLNKHRGTVLGPSGKETYYNLNMSRVVKNMHAKGFTGEYWVRDDGAKMMGQYVMVAANLNVHPRGSLVETSLGTGVVADTGLFAKYNPTQIDIATAW